MVDEAVLILTNTMSLKLDLNLLRAVLSMSNVVKSLTQDKVVSSVERSLISLMLLSWIHTWIQKLQTSHMLPLREQPRLYGRDDMLIEKSLMRVR